MAECQAHHQPDVAAQVVPELPRFGVPDPDGRLVSRGGEAAAVAAEGDGEYVTGVSREGVPRVAGLCVPDDDRCALAPGRQVPAVVAERDAVAVAVDGDVQLKLRLLFRAGSGGIPGPDADRPVVAGGRQARAVRAERHAPDLQLVAADHADDLPGIGVAHLHGVLRPLADQVSTRRVEGDEERDTFNFAKFDAGPVGAYGPDV